MATTSTNTAKRNLQDSARKVQQAANETTHTMREVAEEAGNKVREFVSEKSHQAEEFRHTAEEKIAEHPLKSVAYAALAGLILGALLRR